MGTAEGWSLGGPDGINWDNDTLRMGGRDGIYMDNDTLIMGGHDRITINNNSTRIHNNGWEHTEYTTTGSVGFSFTYALFVMVLISLGLYGLCCCLSSCCSPTHKPVPLQGISY